MSVLSALRHVAELVEGTEPATGQRFVWLDPDAGTVQTLERAHEGLDRVFELAEITATDDGEGGCGNDPRRLLVEGGITIRYRTAGSRHALRAEQASDAQLLRDYLMFRPALWEYGTTGIASILLGQPTAATPLQPAGTTAAVHEVITIPLTMEIEP